MVPPSDKRESDMTGLRELTIDELDIVSGGGDPHYHYCSSGPAGEGLYPNYVPCNPPAPPPGDSIPGFNAILGALGGAAGGGGRPA